MFQKTPFSYQAQPVFAWNGQGASALLASLFHCNSAESMPIRDGIKFRSGNNRIQRLAEFCRIETVSCKIGFFADYERDTEISSKSRIPGAKANLLSTFSNVS